jgi:hypothetical protein
MVEIAKEDGYLLENELVLTHPAEILLVEIPAINTSDKTRQRCVFFVENE